MTRSRIEIESFHGPAGFHIVVRYHQVLCRLGRDWGDSDVVDVLQEALKIDVRVAGLVEGE